MFKTNDIKGKNNKKNNNKSFIKDIEVSDGAINVAAGGIMLAGLSVVGLIQTKMNNSCMEKCTASLADTIVDIVRLVDKMSDGNVQIAGANEAGQEIVSRANFPKGKFRKNNRRGQNGQQGGQQNEQQTAEEKAEVQQPVQEEQQAPQPEGDQK